MRRFWNGFHKKEADTVKKKGKIFDWFLTFYLNPYLELFLRQIIVVENENNFLQPTY